MSPRLDFAAATLIDEGRVKRKDLDVVKNWLQQQRNLPILNDEQIVCFLFSCNNDTFATCATIKAHYNYKLHVIPELFNGRNFDGSDDLTFLLRMGYYVVSPQRTRDGSAIIYYGIKTSISGRYTPSSLKIWLMLFELICKERPPTSLIIISDLKGLNLTHFRTIPITYVRHYVHYLQEGLPLKLKTLYVINDSIFVAFIKTLVKPFMRPQIYNSLKFLQTNTFKQTLAHEIGAECLPQELGGELPCLETLQERTVVKLRAMREYFDAEEKQRKLL